MRMKWMIHTANFCIAVAVASLVTGCEWDRRGHNGAYHPTRAPQQSRQVPYQGAAGARQQPAPTPSATEDEGGALDQSGDSMPRTTN
ncbi:MAG: hypothetical protein ACQESR_09615 [Planctomycetota bacterium]